MPAPYGNTNAVHHGLRMQVSKLPDGCAYIQAATYQLRRHLEAWCLEHRPKGLDLWAALCVNSAVRYEQVSQLCARWLREADGKLSATEKLGYARQIAEASDKRDKVLQRLGIDKSEERDIFAELYGPPTPTALDAPAGGNGTTATGASPGSTPGTSADNQAVSADPSPEATVESDTGDTP